MNPIRHLRRRAVHYRACALAARRYGRDAAGFERRARSAEVEIWAWRVAGAGAVVAVASGVLLLMSR